MEQVFISLGTNLGNRGDNLKRAMVAIECNIGIIVHQSNIYETVPWGYTDPNLYLNMVVEVNSVLEPAEILREIEKIERSMGRIRSKNGYAARTIDLDILFFGNHIINSGILTIPHPYIPDRRFILEPLCDIAPDYIHPVLQKAIKVLLKECPDNGEVKKYYL